MRSATKKARNDAENSLVHIVDNLVDDAVGQWTTIVEMRIKKLADHSSASSVHSTYVRSSSFFVRSSSAWISCSFT